MSYRPHHGEAAQVVLVHLQHVGITVHLRTVVLASALPLGSMTAAFGGWYGVTHEGGSAPISPAAPFPAL